jgi:hypothetical protein
MKEKNGVLQNEETLWDVALRGIGIQLPDEYVLRFCALMKKFGNKDLPNITLSDVAEIEHEARQEMERRMMKFQPLV